MVSKGEASHSDKQNSTGNTGHIMSSQPGIWRAAWTILQRNPSAGLAYVAAMMVIGFLQDHMNSGSGLAIAQAFAAAFLAIPAHLSVLKNVDVGLKLKDAGADKAIVPFVLRGLGLGVLAGIVPLIVLIVMLVRTEGETSIGFLVFGILAIVTFALVFAKWGTMLPATVAGGDKRFAAAGARASRCFGYAFPRLLVSFGLLGVATASTVFLFGMFADSSTFSSDAGIGSVVTSLLFNGLGAYQIAMTAVILSRAYLMAEDKTAAQPVTV